MGVCGVSLLVAFALSSFWAGELVCGCRTLRESEGSEETPPTCRIALPTREKPRGLATEQKRYVHLACEDEAIREVADYALWRR